MTTQQRSFSKNDLRLLMEGHVAIVFQVGGVTVELSQSDNPKPGSTVRLVAR